MINEEIKKLEAELNIFTDNDRIVYLGKVWAIPGYLNYMEQRVKAAAEIGIDPTTFFAEFAHRDTLLFGFSHDLYL